jgi:hypothetical protein
VKQLAFNQQNRDHYPAPLPNSKSVDLDPYCGDDDPTLNEGARVMMIINFAKSTKVSDIGLINRRPVTVYIGDDLTELVKSGAAIEYVQVDGDELAAALSITGLPLSRRVIKFPQPWANLIVMNWK